RRRQNDDHAERRNHREGEDAMPRAGAEIDDRDDRRDRQPISDHGEGPRVARIPFVNEPAIRTALHVRPEPGEERASPAMWAALPQPASDRRDDELPVHRATHDKSTIVIVASL